ncbi:helix-turn-helix domain-containing protein [Rhodococcus erythropolis]
MVRYTGGELFRGKVMPMPSGFAAWVRNQIAARGYQSPEEAARALGVYPSQMLQWTRISRSPTPQVLRRVAALFDAPVQEVLIVAGFMTEEENLPLSPTRMSLQQLSNKQILDEIRRQTAGDLAGPPIPVRVNGVIHFPDGPPTVFVENT